ncbi:MAG: hypothetical protein ACI32C_04930 [Candidatus Enteromonas sp.]
MNKLKPILLLAFSALALCSCGEDQDSPSSSSSSSSSSMSQEASSSSSSSSLDEASIIRDLNNDPNGQGTKLEGTNENRTPDDPLYDLLLDKKRVLNSGETYVEDFEKDAIHTKICPVSADSGASYEVANDHEFGIDNNTLIIHSEGNYAGVTFGGMNFAASGRYTISLDYRCIDVPQTFYFQFRSLTGGTASDVFAQFDGGNGVKMHKTFDINLSNFSDYRIMLFPSTSAASMAIDNISITRNNSRPTVTNLRLTGEAEVGKTLSFEHGYYDAEGDELDHIEYSWIAALDKDGLNQTHLNETSNSLEITEDLNGWYVGISVTAYSKSLGEEAIGLPTIVYTSNPIGGIGIDTGRRITLDYGESFTEDFEPQGDARGDLYFAPQQGSEAYITQKAEDVLSGSSSLRLKSPGSYNATYFSGIRFAPNGIYKLSFDYRFFSKGETCYVQLRSLNGGYNHDKFSPIDLSQVKVGEDYRFEYTFRLNGVDDYALMLFPAQTGYDMVLDNLKIERQEGTTAEIKNVLLEVGDEIHETFDSPNAMKLGIDNAQTPNSGVKQGDDGINGTGYLYVESAGSYKTLMIHKGIEYVKGATYHVTFSYKVLTFVDTIYFQFFGSPSVFEQFGSPSEIGQVKTFDHEFTLNTSAGCLIQIFPGGASGTTSFILDDLVIRRTA